MSETQEQIDLSLAISGEDLVFDVGTVKAIPGQEVYIVPGQDTPYDTEKQDITFYTSFKEFKAKDIQKNSTFTYAKFGVMYSFYVRDFINDFTGWVSLNVVLTSIEDL